jgi:hypothetical protein
MIELKGHKFGRDMKGAYSGPQQQTLGETEGEGNNYLTQVVDFPARGVWYVWLKVRCPGPWPALLTYDLDGIQPLMSARKDILVQPGPESSWVTWSRFTGFRIEINVDKPGKHTLRFIRKEGNAEIEKIFLTLFFSAKMAGDKLDMANDPGAGRADFPHGNLSVDGYRADFAPQKIKSSGKTYFVDSESGDDSASGTSPARAWRSIERVNSFPKFLPGDAILLKRGSLFNHGLHPRGSGTKKACITIGAFGNGNRPIVRGMGEPGVALENQSYWTIQDIAATSDPEFGKSAFSLKANDAAGFSRGLRVINCVAFDSGRHGIDIGGKTGWDGVLVENCLTFCNSNDGICVSGSRAKGSTRNVVIRGCTAYSNPGMAGIWICSAENGLIDRCLAYSNSCVNIWCWNAVNITMRHCEAFRGRPQRDAAGFDIDWGSQACTIEYCYSHHNEGDAFLLMGSGKLMFQGNPMHSNHNIMRWCVAEGQSTIDMGETFDHCKVYNNLSVAFGARAHAFKVFGWPNDKKGGNGGWPADTDVVNNLFVAVDGATAMMVDDYATQQGNRWDHNLYWQTGKRRPLVRWNGRDSGPKFWEGDRKWGTYPPTDYADLESFRKATGQEAHGIQANPRLRRLPSGEYCRLPLSSFRLPAKSPAFGKGKSQVITEEWLKERRKYLTDTGAEAMGIPMDPAPEKVDYWGKPLGAKKPIGPQA